MALEARAGLLLFRHAPGLLLIEESVEVPAPVAVVQRERVAGEDSLEPGVPVELLLGRAAVARAQAPATVLGGRRERGPEVGVVLERPVLAPHLRVHGVLGHFDQPDEGLSGLLLPLE